MSDQTALYRFFDADGGLLYVGISASLDTRFRDHQKRKPWEQVANITIEHHPSRLEALEAERAAIVAECPKWNIVHNRAGRTPTGPQSRPSSDKPFEVESVRGHISQTDLALYWEVNGDPIGDGYYIDEIDAEDLFYEWYRRYVPDDGWVEIHWFVEGGRIGVESWWPYRASGGFSRFYQPPRRAGDDYRPVNWLADVPVVDKLWDEDAEISKGGFIQSYLGWKPSAFQQWVHIPTLLHARNGYAPSEPPPSPPSRVLEHL